MKYLPGVVFLFLLIVPIAAAEWHDFPTAQSTVVGTVPFVDGSEMGWFFSSTLQHGFGQILADPEPALGRVLFDLAVPSNTLLADPVQWRVTINQVDIGGFSVAPGFTGALQLDFAFPPIPADMDGKYDAEFKVASDIPFGQGAHTIGYAAPYPHRVLLLPEPGTLALLGLGGAALLRLRGKRGPRAMR